MTVVIQDLIVESNEDILICCNSTSGADFRVNDNVQLLRTGDLPLNKGYEIGKI